MPTDDCPTTKKFVRGLFCRRKDLDKCRIKSILRRENRKIATQKTTWNAKFG